MMAMEANGGVSWSFRGKVCSFMTDSGPTVECGFLDVDE